MKNKLIYLLCVLTLIYAVVPRAYAMDFVPVYSEEDTSEFENEEQYVFSPQIMETMGGTDSFVDKTATVQDFDVPCKAAFLIEEQTGRILYEKRAEETTPMASITKIMTMLLVMEALDAGKITLNDTVPVSVHAYSMGGSQIWLEPGEIFTVDEMLKAVAVSSANDAAVALAEFIGGSEESFCRMMNSRAKEIGCTGTNFTNANGFHDSKQVSTTRDLVKILNEALKNELFFKFFSETTFTLPKTEYAPSRVLDTTNYIESRLESLNRSLHIVFKVRISLSLDCSLSFDCTTLVYNTKNRVSAAHIKANNIGIFHNSIDLLVIIIISDVKDSER